MSSTSMHYVAGGDRPVPTFVRYSKPRPKPTGLDWSKHRQPDLPASPKPPAPEPKPTPRPKTRRRAPKKRTPRTPAPRPTCTCGQPKTHGSILCATCYHQQRHDDALAKRRTCECGTTIGPNSTRCRACHILHRNTDQTARRSPVDDTTLIAEYTAGDTIPTIARRHGWPIKSTRDALIRTGIPRRDDRTLHSGGRNKIVDSPDVVAAVRTLYLDQGMSQAQTGAQLGLTTKQVQRIMRLHDIPTRDGQCGSGDTLQGYRDAIAELGATSAQIRAWARAKGLPVGVRGAIGGDVLEAYAKAVQS